MRSISQYSVKMRENTDQKNSKYGYFSRSDYFWLFFNSKTDLPDLTKLRGEFRVEEPRKCTKDFKLTFWVDKIVPDFS